MKIGMKLLGEKQVREQLKRASIRMPGAFGVALYAEGAGLYAEARKRVPVDSGALRDSAYVTKPNLRAENIKVEVGFGAPHAWLQHEKQYQHPGGGESKYLKSAVQSAAPGMLQRLATNTQRNFKAGIATVSAVAPTRPTRGKRSGGRLTRASRQVGSRRRRS